ncbi:MAG: phasin superfamily protein [Desulfobacteraceae bacterium 4572_35.2]|nr:MAG: phasin superfamily protein [Desulfobacteraceae bacterium 4572_35.2]
MFEVIEKTLLTALGAASLTQKKAEELTAELKERFNLSEEEGQCLVEKLKNSISERQTELEKQATEEVLKACDRVGLISKEEFTTLEKRVSTLEAQLARP